MPRPLRLLLIFAVPALLLIAVGYWNIRPDSFMQAQGNNTQTAQDIDFFVENAHSIQYQEDGKLRYEMTAKRLEHLKTRDVTLLQQPDLQLFRGTPYPWHVQSMSGEVAPGGKEVELIDEVRIARTDAKNRPTVITTSRMTVFPEQEYAQTAQAVRIATADGVTTAKGMKAYLQDGRMLLLSNVRGLHEVR